MVRAAAKNHANVAIVTSPGQYDDVLAALDAPRRPRRPAPRARWPLEAFAHTAAYDARIAAALPGRMVAAGLARSAPDDPYPPSLTIGAREGRDAALRREPAPAGGPLPAPGRAPRPTARSRRGAPPLQGKALSYNNVLDASAAAAIGRALRGPACVIVKHTNPCGAAERATLVDAWTAALEADPVSAFGGVVAVTRTGGRGAGRARLVSIFLEVVVAPGFEPARARDPRRASRTCASSSTPSWPTTARRPAPDPTGSIRTAGGAVLVTAPDTIPDDPATWTVATRRAADRRRAARPRPRLAAGPRRHLERDRARAGRPAHRARVRARRRGSTPPAAPSPRPWRYAGTGGRGRRRVRLGRVLPVRRRRRGLPRRRASPRSPSPAARSATTRSWRWRTRPGRRWS